MSVAFNGIDNQVVTFQADTGEAGDSMAMEDNNKVTKAPSGAAPVGVLVGKRSGHGAVQIRGYVQVPYSGSAAPSLGWNRLVANGSGGMRLAASGETGRNCLVVNLNTADKTMGLFL